MKKIFPIAILIVFLAACSDDLESKKQMLEDKKAELEKLKTEIQQLEEEIAEIEGGTEELNTGKPVTVQEVSIESYEHKVTIQGIAQSKENIMISPEFSGLMIELLVEEGQVVTAGQTLARIDNQILLQNLQEVEVSLDLANTVYAKQEKLWNQNIGSEIQYLEAKTNVETLEKKKAALVTQIEKTTIVAPIKGTIDEIFPNVGEMVAPGQPFCRLVDLSNMEVHADVPENYLRYVKVGEEVELTFPALNSSTESSVKTIGQFINPTNRTFKIILSIDNPDGMIKPNLMAQIVIPTIQTDSALTLPDQIVQSSSSGDFVYISDPSGAFALKRFVNVIDNFQGTAWIEEGEETVKPGDRIIILGYRDVTDSTAIQIVKN